MVSEARLPYSLDRLGTAGTRKVSSHQVLLSSHCVCRAKGAGRDVGRSTQGILPVQEGSLGVLVTVAASLVYCIGVIGVWNKLADTLGS